MTTIKCKNITLITLQARDSSKPPDGKPRALELLDRRTNTQHCNARFEFYAPGAREVFLVGEFNDWDRKANPMQRGADGIWRAELMLPPGFYRYKFMVDSIWRCSPDQPHNRCDRPCEACPRCVPNAHGSFDRVALVV